jgi:hypothetical protein
MANDSVGESPSKSQDETDERSGASQSAQGSDGGAEGSRSGDASNEYGTVLGSGTAPPPKDTGSSDDDTAHRSTGGSESGPRSSAGEASTRDEDSPSSGDSGTSQSDVDLTDSEREFLRRVIQALNGELDRYDLTQSMTTIRNGVNGEIDEDRLVELGYLEHQSVNTRKYYYVSPAGQDAVDRTIYSGRNDGDPFEKTAHKVYVEYTARHLRNQGLLVETYYEPMAGGMVFDVAAFLPGDGDERTLAVVAEVVTNIRPDLLLKHYDDLASFDGVRKMWVVPHTDVAHEIIRVLADAGRLQTVPHRDIENYARLSEQAFENPREWRFVGGRNLVRKVDRMNAESDGDELG